MRGLFCLFAFASVTTVISQPVSRQWIKTTSFAGTDTFDHLVVDAQGNSFAAGYAFQGTVLTMLVSKFDRNGVKAWDRVFPPSVGTSYAENLAVDSGGNVIVAGSTDYVDNLHQKSRLLKLSPAGSVLWDKIGTGACARWMAVAVDSLGEISVTGLTNPGTGEKIRTSHFLANGSIAWEKDYAYPGLAVSRQPGESIAIDSTRNILVCGLSYGPSAYRNTVLKYSPAGTLLWARHAANSSLGLDYPRGFTLYSGTNCAVLTTVYENSANSLFLTTFDTNGVRTTNYGGPIQVGSATRPSAQGLRALADGSFVAFGSIDAPTGPSYISHFRTIFKSGTMTTFGNIGNIGGAFCQAAAPGLTGGEYYYSFTPQNAGSGAPATIAGVLPTYPSGNLLYSWGQKVFGSTANSSQPVAQVNAMEVDNRGDLICAGLLTGSQNYDAFIVKYECWPYAGDDVYSTQVGQTLTLTSPGFRSNDVQASQAALAITGQPQHGTLTAFNEGSFSYAPDAGFAGVDRAAYRLTRTNGTLPTASDAEVTFTVYPTVSNFVFDPPSLKGGQSTILRATVATKPATSLTLRVEGYHSAVTNTGFIVIAKQSNFGEDTVFTEAVGTVQTATYTIRSGSSSRTATLTLNP